MSGPDIVERLRRYAPHATRPSVAAIMDEAADTITALQAEVARKDAALDNIRALAVKSQRVGGPNGTLAHIEGFARAALERTKP